MPPKKDAKVAEQPVKQAEPELQPHQLTGYGRFQYLNGAIYEGNWMIIKGNKMKHGYGKLTLPTIGDLPVQSYEGDWFEDQMHGFGIYNYPEGHTYHGEWSKNKQNGRGIFQFANGTKYEGQWEDHLMHGEGEFTDHLGRRWKGEYRKGQFDSRSQKNLIKEISLVGRTKEIENEVMRTIQKLLKLLQEGFQEQYKIKAFFNRNEGTERLLRQHNPPKLENKTLEQWATLFSFWKEGKCSVLLDKKQSKILPPEAILAEQLQGCGQVVQIFAQNGQGLAMMCLSNNHWMVAGVASQQK